MGKGGAICRRGILALGASAMNTRHQKQGEPKAPIPNAVEVKPGLFVANSSTSVFTPSTKKK